ncbi:hypothetical protein ALC56_00543 [Trachymyrmex septentrionalis]|uniref:DUF4817 domain-containing protein n=1 Tax=Trachymyrmex septentrionalis TaxID=34720 RepID=A0A195FZ22_9HYME|nr:hypothetical protein ALC56_00543 [Trachymyrmex septentrionalis]
MRYMKAKKVDMIFVYGKCRQIMREAVRLYAERFPDRVHPSFSVFSSIIKTFQETGSVYNKKCKRIKKATNNENSTNILAAIALNPYISTKQLERESDINRNWVNEFKRGRTSTCNALRLGRPIEAATPEIIGKVHDIVLTDRRVKVRELVEAIGLSHWIKCIELKGDYVEK